MNDIIAELSNATTKKRLQSKYGIAHLRIFGSYAKGRETDASDIDLLYTNDTTSDPLSFVDARYYLKRKLKKSVDLVHVDVLEKSIRKDVLAHRIAIW